jgi:hypothetical protein
VIFLGLFILLGCTSCGDNSLPASAEANVEPKLLLITLDGLRWEELFGGAVDSLLNDTEYVRDTAALIEQFWAESPRQRREILMPFFWEVLADQGQIYGNRLLGNKVNVVNDQWFSYPGYNEILTGFADSNITSNDKILNPNTTVLEWINQRPGFDGKVAAFGSWDVFPYIIHEQRSGVPVNAGFETAEGPDLSEKELFLNELQPQIPSPWATVRLDAFTHGYALEYMKRQKPRVVYIAYGETDDFAHDGDYDHYLQSTLQTDKWIRELWEYVQSEPFYRDQTTMLITTDHGRGHNPKDRWRGHGVDYEGSDAIWIAAIGPGVPALGEVSTEGQLFQNQMAKTAARFLGLEYSNQRPVGEAIPTVMGE